MADYEFGGIDLETLLGGMSLSEFRATYMDKRTLVAHGALLGIVDRILSLERFDEIVTTQNLTFPKLEAIVDGKRIAPVRLGRRIEVIDLEEKIRNGATLRLTDIDDVCGEVNAICAMIGDRLDCAVQANAYFTPTRTQAFIPHYDDHDIIIVQCFGEKRWRTFDSYSEQQLLPLVGAGFDPKRHKPAPDAVIEEFTMKAGDVLYMPRGVMHEAFCEDGASLHISFGMGIVTVGELLIQIVKGMQDRDVELRTTLDYGVLLDPSRMAETIRPFVERMVDDVAKGDGGQLAEAALTRLVKSLQPMRAGGIVAAMRSRMAPPADAATRYLFVESMVWRAFPDRERTRVITAQRAVVMGPNEYAILCRLKSEGSVVVGEIQESHPDIDVVKTLTQFESLGITRRAT